MADLDDDESSAIVVGRFEVDVSLIVRDVEALDGAGSLLNRCWGSIGCEEDAKQWSEEELHGRVGSQWCQG